MKQDELKVWEIIKENPDELGFILQEQNYEAYKNTFSATDEVILTEEQFNLVKDFFTKMRKQ